MGTLIIASILDRSMFYFSIQTFTFETLAKNGGKSVCKLQHLSLTGQDEIAEFTHDFIYTVARMKLGPLKIGTFRFLTNLEIAKNWDFIIFTNLEIAKNWDFRNF